MQQSFLKPFRAIAIAACPRLSAVFVTAILPVVRVLDAQELKVFLPIRSLFLQRSGAVADLHPMRDAVPANARLLRVVQVFLARDRTLSERAVGRAFSRPGFARALAR